MGFHFQRRLNIGGGWGINMSKSLPSISYRGKHGSIGTNGMSIKTGIPGLSYKMRWSSKKDKNGYWIIATALGFSWLLFAYVLMIILPAIIRVILWLLLTSWDFAVYLKNFAVNKLKND